MERVLCQPRDNWAARLEAHGFDFHTLDGVPYWSEGVCYQFTAEEIDQLEAATEELHAMCLSLVEDTVRAGDYHVFSLDTEAATLVERSWKMQERALMGRMDLRFDGRSPPKLYEYNADTPTSLFEASAIQWFWLQDVYPQADQFNSIHEKLIAAWRHRWNGTLHTVHFASFTASVSVVLRPSGGLWDKGQSLRPHKQGGHLCHRDSLRLCRDSWWAGRRTAAVFIAVRASAH